MTLAAKQRLVVGMLVVLAAWPLVHRVLVWRYDIDPWRFFGWAMYCTPKLPAEAVLFAYENGEQEPVPIMQLSRRERRAVARLLRRRELWGTLASPDRAGAALLAAHPHADAIEVVVKKWYLDPETASIAVHVEPHRFERR